jgi:hypothetical protein
MLATITAIATYFTLLSFALALPSPNPFPQTVQPGTGTGVGVLFKDDNHLCTVGEASFSLVSDVTNNPTSRGVTVPFNSEMFETSVKEVVEVVKVPTGIPVICSFYNTQGTAVLTLQPNLKAQPNKLEAEVHVHPPQVLLNAICRSCPAGVL